MTNIYICPVCNKKYETNVTECQACGFVDKLGINRVWASQEDAGDWIKTVIEYRTQWKAHKKETQIINQLDEVRRELEESKVREQKHLQESEDAKGHKGTVEQRLEKIEGLLEELVKARQLHSSKIEIIRFGDYDWQVLERENDKVLLLSDKILDKVEYNNDVAKITWEQCTMRQYLNEEFYNKFGLIDKSRIVQMPVVSSNNIWYGTDNGPDTNDYIFLLSLEEVVRYFGDSGQLKNRPSDTTYSINDVFNSNRIAYEANGVATWWWLRSSGSSGYSATFVDDNGVICNLGLGTSYGVGVRPALWLKL